MLTFFLKAASLIINNWIHLSHVTHVALQDHLHHLTRYEDKGTKPQFSNFLVNWGKFRSAI